MLVDVSVTRHIVGYKVRNLHQSFFIYQLMHKNFALKEILKFSDMFSFNYHHQEACYLSFAKVTVAKTVTLTKLK
jgi:hypothetical protein